LLYPFAVFFCALLVLAGFMLFMWICRMLAGVVVTEGWYFRYVESTIANVLFGVAYTATAWHLAPRAKRTTGIVMVIILGFVVVFSAAIVWVTPDSPMDIEIADIVGLIATLIAAVGTLIWKVKEA